jgi:hypothetical protein
MRGFGDLNPTALALSISSAAISRKAAGTSEASLYLFQGQTSIGPGDYRLMVPQAVLVSRVGNPFLDFHGDFLRLTLPGGPTGGSNRMDDLTDAGFNDKTTSVMLVERWQNGAHEETVSAANTFTFGWDAALLGLLPLAQLLLGGGVAISRFQDPVFSWLAFPPTNSGFPTNFTYMVLSQWFVFHASGIGVNVWLVFYFRLGLDGNSKVELNVIDMDYYVWPGTGQGQMMNALQGAKNGIVSALQTLATPILGNVKGTVCDDVYLLPGMQPNAATNTNASARGSALTDVTIVLVNPR